MKCYNEKKNEAAVRYVISFMLGEQNEHVVKYISYGYDAEAKVVIEPSGFFDDGVYLTTKSLPKVPLGVLDGIPVLFGSPHSYYDNGRLHIQADLVASAFFLMTRYEECVRRNCRDEHGRFSGKKSLPFRAGFLDRPIIDEYGAFLRRHLLDMGVDVKLPTGGFRHVYLTHDIDHIYTWDSYVTALESVAKRILRRQPDKFLPLRAMKNYKRYDPVFTFPDLVEFDRNTIRLLGGNKCSSIYFVMGCLKRTDYDNGYMSNVERTVELLDYLASSGCQFGCHVSYSAAMNRNLLPLELDNIKAFVGESPTKSRNHYLCSREPEDYHVLIANGIKDDFTMAYADQAGFRLGTSRPVRWIDPLSYEVTSLTLHPMTVMDCTLDRPSYMGIEDEDEAFKIVELLVRQVSLNGGEVVLLWHNSSLAADSSSYQRNLYQRALDLVSLLDNDKVM